MDNRTGSSGETTIDLFENYPFTTKVGQNTFGAVHFGNMGFCFLPNSKLCFSAGIQFRKYKDNRYIEGKGISPDIYVHNENDAYKIAIKNLRKIIKYKNASNYN